MFRYIKGIKDELGKIKTAIIKDFNDRPVAYLILLVASYILPIVFKWISGLLPEEFETMVGFHFLVVSIVTGGTFPMWFKWEE